MSDGSYWYDVALSFSDSDRTTARKLARALEKRGITVFYDEHVVIWGVNLVAHLQQIYRDQSRFCIPLFSERYSSGKWPKLELQAARERALEEEDYLLPIRLDDAEIPEIPSIIACLDLRKIDVEAVSDMVVSKLAEAPSPSPSRPLAPRTPQRGSPTRMDADKVEEFDRILSNVDAYIVDDDLMAQLDALSGNPSPRKRLRFAQDLARIGKYRRVIRGGPAYTAWQSDDRVFLSLLPSVGFGGSGQRTFEFEIQERERRLALVAEWHPSNSQWAAIDAPEFHAAVSGIEADRSGCDIQRESTLHVLGQRGAQFGFPAAPTSGDPERFCVWIPREDGDRVSDWDRDPRLEGPHFGPNGLALEHRPTGVGILLTSFSGSWSNRAIYALLDSLDLLLPWRHNTEILSSGCLRLDVYLSQMPPGGGKKRDRDFGFVHDAIARAHVSIARAVAAEREIPIKAPSSDLALATLDEQMQASYSAAAADLGAGELPSSLSRERQAGDWGHLKDTLHCRRLGVSEKNFPFDFNRVVSRGELESYIAEMETGFLPADPSS